MTNFILGWMLLTNAPQTDYVGRTNEVTARVVGKDHCVMVQVMSHLPPGVYTLGMRPSDNPRATWEHFGATVVFPHVVDHSQDVVVPKTALGWTNGHPMMEFQMIRLDAPLPPPPPPRRRELSDLPPLPPVPVGVTNTTTK